MLKLLNTITPTKINTYIGNIMYMVYFKLSLLLVTRLRIRMGRVASA